MMRRKGWCQQYLDMTHSEAAAELRRLEQGRGYIYDREPKLAFLRNPRPIMAGPIPASLLDDLGEPGHITWLPHWPR